MTSPAAQPLPISAQAEAQDGAAPSAKAAQSPDLDLLFAVGTMRFIPRMWRQFYMKDTANLAEHSNRVAWIALLLALRAQAAMAGTGEAVDIGRTVQLALIHDMDEIRTGDVQYVSRYYTERKSERAMRDTVAGTTGEAYLLALQAELSAQATLEAKLAKDADHLDVDIELLELAYMGHKFPETSGPVRDKIRKLKTDAGRAMLEEIKTGDPTRWFFKVYNNQGID